MQEKIEELQTRGDRRHAELDAALREAQSSKGGWNELDIEYWLHPLLHSLLGYLSVLSERIANIEDMLLRIAEPSLDRPTSIPEADYRTEQDRQEIVTALQSLTAQDRLIRQLIDLDRPVSESDRANIGTLLLRFRDWNLGLANGIRELKGKPPIPRPVNRQYDDTNTP